MSNYIVSINHKSRRGKLLFNLLYELNDDKSVAVSSFVDFEKKENAVIASEIRKVKRTALLNYEKSKLEFSRLRKKLTR